MTLVRVLPAILALLVLAAHFLRAGAVHVVVPLLVIAGLVIAVRRRWVARLTQVVLALGALEWLTTLLDLVLERSRRGQPMGRLVVILGVVVLLTALSALAFQTRAVCAAYRRGRQPERQGPAGSG